MTKSRIQSILNRNLVYLGFVLASIAGEISWLFNKAPEVYTEKPIAVIAVLIIFVVTIILGGMTTLNSIDYERKLDQLQEKNDG